MNLSPVRGQASVDYDNTIYASIIKSHTDTIFKKIIKKNLEALKSQLLEIRTTDKKVVYDYHVNSNKLLIPKSSEYLLTYSIYYPDLDYQTEIEILIDENFKLKDSSAFEDIPDYIKNDSERDIITKFNALTVARDSGLAKGDTLTIMLVRNFKTKELYWYIESDWKKEIAQLEKEFKNEGGPRRRRSRPNDKLFVNAKTKEVLTRQELLYN